MIAYNHYIKFVPELKHEEKVEGSFVDTVTVRENIGEAPDKLYCNMIFPESQGRELALYTNGEFAATQKGQMWAFEVKNVVTFFWSSATLNVEYLKHESFTEALLKYWTLHVVLPIFFIIENIYDFLHAGAVEVDGEPILFIAPSMGGKSTMTDYFMKQGHTMISDDKVATFQKESKYYAVSSFPYHRPYRNVEDLGFFVKDFACIPKPMHTMYALESAASDKEVSISQLSGIEKFKSLRDAKEMNLFFHESVQFKYLAKISQTISVFKVIVPRDLGRLNEVYQAIIEHHSAVKGV